MENFEQLASQYQPMIHKIIHSLNIYKNTDEFYQIGLIALWDAQKNYREEKGSFSSFAYSWIKGKILNQLAKDKKQQERNLFPEEEFWEMAVDHHSNILYEDELFETYCQTLTEKETKWLIKACYFGLSIKEIAESENASVSAVKQWRTSARKKLREQMKTVQ